MAHHHDCECGHDHHHEHEHESNSVQIDRYHEAFNKFEPALPDTQTTETVNALFRETFPRKLYTGSIENDSWLHRLDLIDQSGYQRKHLEDGRHGK